MSTSQLIRALVVAIALAGPAAANEPAAPAPATSAMPPSAAAAPLPPSPAVVLEAGKPVEIACETKAVVVAEGAPAATKGAMALKLELTEAAPKPQGKWSIASVDTAHKGSLAKAHEATCATGCPLTLGANGDIQLWSPAPKSLDKLAANEILVIAVVRADATLRASTFKGPQIEALEEGHCRKDIP